MSEQMNGTDPMSIDTEPVSGEKVGDDDNTIAIIDPDVELPDEPALPKLRADDAESMKVLLFPEDPNLEVEHEATYTWPIVGWRKMDRRCYSPNFECGGCPWRILFFPHGNNCDCASFYLEHGYGDKTPEKWYRCVQFGLVLWNPNDPTHFFHHQANHRFTAEEADWGFTRFVELRELVAVSDKWPRPLMENDSAHLTAYLRIMKDPTGVLWHNFIGYDSKQETGYVGLKNQGATCYLNSLLQSLYFTNSFRRAVYKIPTENEGVTNSAFTLQRLFYNLQTSADAVPTSELTRSFGWETQDIFAQQDVQELNRILMENLENKMKGTEVENLLNKMFVGKTKTYIKCIDVDYRSERIEDFWDIQLNVRGYQNLGESFSDYIAVEVMNGENKYFAEGHGLQDAKKGVIFESFPDVLHLHLKRFEYDLNTYAMCKVNDHYEFPDEFDASPYLSDEADKEAGWEYVLHGVLVHSGDLNAGHYYAFLRPEKNGEFYKFDDDRVTRATKREALDENFGGEYNFGHNDVTRLQQNRLPIKRSMNAYMLVYLRKNKIDEILVPVATEDVPEHLPKRLQEERTLREQKKRDREEQHLYLNVRVITEMQYKAHQGFDLASWDDKEAPPEALPVHFRYKKAESMRDLVGKVADDLKIDPQQLRLWVMVNRQNKTMRPDQPLTDLDKTVEETQMKHNSKLNDFRLWAEVTELSKVKDAPFNKEANPNSPWIVIFLKQYDPLQPSLLGVGHVYMRRNDKVVELLPIIHELMGWQTKTEVMLWEEIKPTMIELVKPKFTFHQAEIQDGDIICFQKVSSEKEAEAIKEKKVPKDAKEFYDFLLNLTTIRFIPKDQGRKDFMLQLSKKNTYDEVAEKVGAQLGVPPTHLRFALVNAQTGQPRQAVKRMPTTTTLTQMITSQYYAQPTSPNQLYYEVLEMSLAELETKKPLKFFWLPEGISKEDYCEALVPKNGSFSDVLPYIMKKFNLPEQSLNRIRFFQSHSGKFRKEIPPDHSVVGLMDFTTLYAEIVPEEEIDCNLEVCRIIEAFHFHKEPSKIHTSGVPFKFVVKKGERFEDTKTRLQARTGVKGKPFEKIKFALVRKSAYSKPLYLNDDDILYDLWEDDEDLLGLDHVDRNTRNGWGRGGGPEIRIR